jgi:hypothetical protein
MHTRSSAAATALLLTASAAGLALTSGSTAQAAGSHANHRAAPKLVVTIKSKPSGPVLSDTKFRPGNTIFRVKKAGAGGLMQVFRLKPGYTIIDAGTDFGLAFPSDESTPPDVNAVRRLDKNVVFYGGARVKQRWAVNIDKAGTYFVLNIEANTPPTTFRAKGHHQKRGMPSRTGWLNAATANDGVTNIWKAGKHNAAQGWMSTTNNAKEPHFVVLDHVKKATTIKQVIACFSGGPCHIQAKDHASIDTGVISPRHKFLWTYDLPRGKYLAQCFWPSRIDGTPHALMGMLKLLQLG